MTSFVNIPQRRTYKHCKLSSSIIQEKAEDNCTNESTLVQFNCCWEWKIIFRERKVWKHEWFYRCGCLKKLIKKIYWLYNCDKKAIFLFRQQWKVSGGKTLYRLFFVCQCSSFFYCRVSSKHIPINIYEKCFFFLCPWIFLSFRFAYQANVCQVREK